MYSHAAGAAHSKPASGDAAPLGATEQELRVITNDNNNLNSYK